MELGKSGQEAEACDAVPESVSSRLDLREFSQALADAADAKRGVPGSTEGVGGAWYFPAFLISTFKKQGRAARRLRLKLPNGRGRRRQATRGGWQ